MSEFDDAFVELLDCNDEVLGTPQIVLIEGRKHRAIIEEITVDEIIVAGGNAESGGFRAKTRKADFADRPEQGDEIKRITDDRALSILSIIERNGVEYEILAGDPASEV
jgi:hypothetical protein